VIHAAGHRPRSLSVPRGFFGPVKAAPAAALALLVSVVGGWFVAHGHTTLLTAAIVAAGAVAVVLTRPVAGLLLGVGIALVIPSWWKLGIEQLNGARFATLLVVGGALLLAVVQQHAPARLTFVDAAAVGLAIATLGSWATSARGQNTLQATVNAIVPLGFYVGGRLAPSSARRVLPLLLVTCGALASLTVLWEFAVAHRPLFISQDSYLWNAKGELIFRPGGVFGSPPAAATVLAMTTLAGTALLSTARGARRFGVWLLLAVNGAGLVVTFTRAGLIALAAGVVVYVAVARPAGSIRFAFGISVMALAFALLALPRIQDASWYRSGVLRQGDLAIRQVYWKQAWPLITNSGHHLVLGHGINSLMMGRPELPGAPDRDLAAAPVLLQIGPHNQYVRTLFEQGLIGLALVALFFGGGLVRGFRASFRLPGELRPEVGAAAGGVSAFLVTSFAGDTLRNPPSYAVAALLAGVLVTYGNHARSTA